MERSTISRGNIRFVRAFQHRQYFFAAAAQRFRICPAEQAFREMARLSGGAWCRFDPGAAAQLRDLLRAAAAYAAGGREALRRLAAAESGAALLLGQMT